MKLKKAADQVLKRFSRQIRKEDAAKHLAEQTARITRGRGKNQHLVFRRPRRPRCLAHWVDVGKGMYTWSL